MANELDAKVDAEGRTLLSLSGAALTGMGLALHAKASPDRMAIVDATGSHSFGQLNARANQIVRALRAQGLSAGDGVALFCSNRVEFVEVYAATLRGGFRLTPINWHLTAKEVGYIVDNCEAKAFFVDADFAAVAHDAAKQAPGLIAKVAIGGNVPGFDGHDALCEGQSSSDLEDPALGNSMLYTSGTTGRPKGVYRRGATQSSISVPIVATAGFDPATDVTLVTGPLYHAAPLAINLALPLMMGVGCVLMETWDAKQALALIETHSVSHSHLVPTMFHRLLSLDEATRAKYDLSSLRWIVHGAAPCPNHVKAAMIEWWGPILYEYYAATEGGGFWIDSHEWLKKPGSVGRADSSRFTMQIQDESGEEVPGGDIGTVYFKAPEHRFEYFKAPEKTASAYRGDYYTMGDLGRLDDEGYLFLTGRSAELIISGGVNIYPAEVDAVLLQHPAVGDAATVGVPNDEWGEEVRAVVELSAGIEVSAALKAELIAFCREHLAGYKCPRAVEFVTDLPRLDSGKIQRAKVRDRYLLSES